MVWIITTNSKKVPWKEKFLKSKSILDDHLGFFGLEYKGEGTYELKDGSYLDIKIVDKAEDLNVEVL